MHNYPCTFCAHSQLNYARRTLHHKYFEQFNFYFAKPITEILSNVSVDHVIYFKDLLFLNDDNEYLKRMYSVSEVPERIEILTQFYSQNVHYTANLCKVSAHKIMDKRIQKMHKLAHPRQVEQPPANSRKMLPERLFSDNYIEESMPDEYHIINVSSQIRDISWDSHSHNIYSEAANEGSPPTGERMPLSNEYECDRLYNNENDPELDNVFKEVNKLSETFCARRSFKSDLFKKKKVPALKLDSTNLISSLMKKKYDQVLQKRFHKPLTERGPPPDELLLKIYKSLLQKNKTLNDDQKKKFQNRVYLPKSVRVPPSQISSPSTTNLQNTCSPSMLLRSLSNPSMQPSPARRLEIKVNLNKLIQRQDAEIGYWTQRPKH